MAKKSAKSNVVVAKSASAQAADAAAAAETSAQEKVNVPCTVTELAKHEPCANDPMWSLVWPKKPSDLNNWLAQRRNEAVLCLPLRNAASLCQPVDSGHHAWFSQPCELCKRQDNFCRLHHWLPAMRGGPTALIQYHNALLAGFIPFTQDKWPESLMRVLPHFFSGDTGVVISAYAHKLLEQALQQWLKLWLRNLEYMQTVRASELHRRRTPELLYESDAAQLADCVGLWKDAVENDPTENEERNYQVWHRIAEGKFRNPYGVMFRMISRWMNAAVFGPCLTASASPYVLKTPFTSTSHKVRVAFGGTGKIIESSDLDTLIAHTSANNSSSSQYIFAMPLGHYLSTGVYGNKRLYCLVLHLIEKHVVESFSSPYPKVFEDSMTGRLAEELYWAARSNLLYLRSTWRSMISDPLRASYILEETQYDMSLAMKRTNNIQHQLEWLVDDDLKIAMGELGAEFMHSSLDVSDEPVDDNQEAAGTE